MKTEQEIQERLSEIQVQIKDLSVEEKILKSILGETKPRLSVVRIATNRNIRKIRRPQQTYEEASQEITDLLSQKSMALSQIAEKTNRSYNGTWMLINKMSKDGKVSQDGKLWKVRSLFN